MEAQEGEAEVVFVWPLWSFALLYLYVLLVAQPYKLPHKAVNCCIYIGYFPSQLTGIKARDEIALRASELLVMSKPSDRFVNLVAAIGTCDR